VRLFILTESAAVVDLGRVEVLFFNRAPVAVKDCCNKKGRKIPSAADPVVSELITNFFLFENFEIQDCERSDLEEFIVLAYTSPYPIGRTPRTHSPQGAESE